MVKKKRKLTKEDWTKMKAIGKKGLDKVVDSIRYMKEAQEKQDKKGGIF